VEKRETTLEKVYQELKEFYDAKQWHFLTLNGVELNEHTLEIQWIFSSYTQKDMIVVWYIEVEYGVIIPSIEDIIPSSIISQRELVDMFGIDIEGSDKGLYLDEDSLQTPLRCGVSYGN
jgi:NADH:ubiquinone oxidoreductase subunit C